ncbi:MAG: chromosome segregation protein SMC [Burkholderiaceae bacterium]|nr:chromosome segregation protein SMC [Burkholderiaceae bacterium]
MQLKSIKLSGFKSFVDPTHFELPGQLIGVVGPNGCGKSNIIDAVRWVLGESRASELRGESMQDVIFNGSGLRKPSGRASVELIFDNADGRAHGQWSSFTELSVKRVLTRDGNSSYYINNQVVRRKDVQDIFLGTGLGPRAYAIIGQGTISRILESKPEELRVFLEEAAGVSKYKERRKETASRLEDTQENLVRVQDILRELEQQLARLEAQAEVASRHNELLAQMKSQQHLLWFVKQTESGKEQEKHANAIRETQVKLEEETSKLRHAESELETMRTQQYALQDVVSKAQGDLYETNAEVSQIESEIKYVHESRQRLQEQVADLQAQLDRWTTQEKDAAQAQRQAEQEFRQASENEASLQAEFVQLQQRLPVQDQAYQSASNALDQARSVLSGMEQRIVSLQERYKAGESQTEEVSGRASRLRDELAGMRKPDDQALQMATDRHIMAQRKAEDAKLKASQTQEHVPATDAIRQKALEQIQKANQDVHQSEAKLTALTTLQASVQAQGKIGPWLESKGLKESKRLWQELKVEKGWEPALESVLRERLAALTGKSINETLSLAKDAPPSRLAILLTDGTDQSDSKVPAGFITLLSRVQASGTTAGVLQEWLSNIYIADNLEDALRRRSQLTKGSALVTQEGHMVTRVGVQLYAPDSEQAGMLARAQEMESLDAAGFDTSLIKISPMTHIVQSKHIIFDKENLADKLGTTSRGIAPTYSDKYARTGLQFAKIAEESATWEEHLFDGRLYGNILCEGAQGFHLDIDWGNYPYCTSSVTLPYAACSVGFSPKKIRNIYAVTKIYDTRSGEDPVLFPDSLFDNPELDLIGTVGQEIGTTTGRRRKVNHMNLDRLIFALNTAGGNKLIISKCDILEQVQIFRLFYHGERRSFVSLDTMKEFITDRVMEECPEVERIYYSYSAETVENLTVED